jgi:hypothetical protein
VTKDASPRIIELLVSSGVRKQVWRLPAEVREPHYAGAPLTPDDILDFHLLLERDGWLADLEQTLRGSIDR